MSTLLVALRAAAEITRLRILSVLRNSELTVSEIVHILDQSQPRVSRHLKLLVDSGLLTRYQEGAWVFHRIADSGESAAIAQGVLQLIDLNDAQMVQDQKRLQQINREIQNKPPLISVKMLLNGTAFEKLLWTILKLNVD